MTRWIARLIVFVRIIAPWMWRFATYCLKLAATSLVATLKGFPPTIRAIANDWVDKAIRAGFPSLYARELYYLFCVVATAMLVAGWVILSHITVWLFWRIV